MNRSRVLLLTAAAFLAAVVVFTFTTSPLGSGAEEAAPAATIEVSATPLPQAQASVPLSVGDGRSGSQATESPALASPALLMARVRAGDERALKSLRDEQIACEHSVLSPEEATTKVELLQGAEREQVLRSELALMQRCAAFNSLPQSAKTEIVLRVAESGDARALRQYVFETPSKLTGPLAVDEFRAYREASQRLLEVAFERGDSGAIAARGIAYRNGTAYRRDPIESAANLQAYVRLEARGALGVQSLLHKVLDGLTPEQRAAANSRTEEILASFRCSNCGH